MSKRSGICGEANESIVQSLLPQPVARTAGCSTSPLPHLLVGACCEVTKLLWDVFGLTSPPLPSSSSFLLNFQPFFTLGTAERR